MDDETRVESLDTQCHLSYKQLCAILVQRLILHLNVTVQVTSWHVLGYNIIGLCILEAFYELKHFLAVRVSKLMKNFKLLELLIVDSEATLDFCLFDDFYGILGL